MQQETRLNKILLCLTIGLFIWFFASSISIAYHKAPQHDDVMFATVSKNFLNGYGWATSYGEKIPFNPDISTGPTLWIPCAAMIAAFGAQTWTPAMTGVLMNIGLTLLILWQLYRLAKYQAAAFFALLLSLSLFAVNDFKTFTAYYTASLLFIFALLLVLNQQYSKNFRLLAYGALAAIGLYAKPLILLSFLVALPCLLVIQQGFFTRAFFTSACVVLFGFFITLAPWHLYKTAELSRSGDSYQHAYHDYSQKFFAQHGSGIHQLRTADNTFSYVQKNSRKNYRVLNHFLNDEYNLPLYVLLTIMTISLGFLVNCLYQQQKDTATLIPFENALGGILSIVIAVNLLWYVIISFAMTPGHAFFLTFFSFFLLFFLLATQSRSNLPGIILCTIVAMFFQVRHEPLIDAYSFHAKDTFVDNKQIQSSLQFLQKLPTRYPLASCGYAGAPWQMEFLLPKSQNFVDCYNVLEDSLALDEVRYLAENPGINLSPDGRTLTPTEHFFTQGLHHEVMARFSWKASPDFTLSIEGFGLLAAAKSQGYVLNPMAEACRHHMLYQSGFFLVCEVPFAEIKAQLDPTETARQLADYQLWYRTRIKVY